MTTTPRSLTTEQRSFLSKVYEAAFANPFGEDRVQLDMSIAGIDKVIPPGERLAAAIEKVDTFLLDLAQPKPVRIQDFNAVEQPFIKHAILFSIFHRVMPQFDNLIARQLQTREGTCPVPFARETLAEMHKYGLDSDEANRYFALFYQLRRAYYFIHQSLVGRCNSMQSLRMVLWNNVFTHDMRLYVESLWDRMEDFATLILGETGTGKGAAAAAIGRSGFIPFNAKQNAFCESFMASFVELNLSQFPESLIESELFGHRKGAFSGAIEDHSGAFSLCSPHGSVFLDEIGDVSIPVQIKLLRVLQDRVYSSVGSHERKRFHGRVIAATNKPLDELRRSGQFRDDFYYRLCSDQIRVPSLQQRIQEDPRELDDLLAIVTPRITGDADVTVLKHLKTVIIKSVGADYPWPGNVRELEQCVRRILLSGVYAGQQSSPSSSRDQLQDGIRDGSYSAQALLADYCRQLYATHGTYEAVAKITDLDRRTVKKHLTKEDSV